MYAPLLVLPPGERYDPDTDRVFMFGDAVDGDSVGFTINGRREPPPQELRAGVTYRLRFANIHPAGAAVVELSVDSTRLAWRPIAKDGAELPAAAKIERPARLRRFGTGETYDFAWTPAHAMEAVMTVEIEGVVRRQRFRVR
jgi:hypothetical protein